MKCCWNLWLMSIGTLLWSTKLHWMGIALSLGMKNHSGPSSDLQAEPMNVGSALLCAIATLMPLTKAWFSLGCNVTCHWCFAPTCISNQGFTCNATGDMVLFWSTARMLQNNPPPWYKPFTFIYSCSNVILSATVLCLIPPKLYLHS